MSADDVRGEEYEAAKPYATRQELPQATSYRYVGRNQQPHLPECLLPDFDKGVWVCICKQLRACEARVRDEVATPTWSYGVGREAGISLAREAVAALRDAAYESRSPWQRALAAIDALQEKP